MDNKYIALAVTMAVGLILAGSVLMPVLEESSGQLTEIVNSQEAVAREYLNEIEHTTIIKHAENAQTVTIEGVDETFTSAHLILYCDTLVVNSTSSTFHIDSTKIYIGSNAEWKLTLANNVWVLEFDDTEYTDSYSFAFINSDNGQYGVYVGGANIAKLNFNGNQFVGAFEDSGSEVSIIPLTKLMDMQAEATVITKNPVTFGTKTAAWEVYEKGENYGLRNLTLDGVAASVVIIAPVQYITHEDNTASGLIAAIPIMVIVALLMFAVQAIRMRND